MPTITNKVRIYAAVRFILNLSLHVLANQQDEERNKKSHPGCNPDDTSNYSLDVLLPSSISSCDADNLQQGEDICGGSVYFDFGMYCYCFSSIRLQFDANDHGIGHSSTVQLGAKLVLLYLSATRDKMTRVATKIAIDKIAYN